MPGIVKFLILFELYGYVLLGVIIQCLMEETGINIPSIEQIWLLCDNTRKAVKGVASISSVFNFLNIPHALSFQFHQNVQISHGNTFFFIVSHPNFCFFFTMNISP